MTHVLIVDDETAIREALRFLLEDTGHTVTEARNGLEGLALLRTSQQRLVTLLDLNMPMLDGLAVLRTVSQEPLLASLHAYVLVTAFPDRLFSTSLATILLSQLAVPVVRKPFDIDTLLDTVTSAARRLGGSQPHPTA